MVLFALPIKKIPTQYGFDVVLLIDKLSIPVNKYVKRIDYDDSLYFYVVQEEDDFYERIYSVTECKEEFDFEYEHVRFKLDEVKFESTIKVMIDFDLDQFQPAFRKYDGRLTVNGMIYSKVIYLKRAAPMLRGKEKSNMFEVGRNGYIELEWKWYRAVLIQYRATCEEYLINEQQNVKQMFDISNVLPRHKKTYKIHSTICIAYDCETIQVNDRHVPYMLYAKEFTPNEPYDPEEGMIFESQEWGESNAVGYEFVNWIFENIVQQMIDDQCNRYDNMLIRLVGFNNYRFDDNFIIDALRKRPEISMYLNSRFGKSTQEVFWYKGIRIEICDMVTWCPDMSLKQATEDYELTTQKMDVNIVEYNNACKRKGEFITRDTIANASKIMTGQPMRIMLFLRQKYMVEGVVDVWKLIQDYCRVDVEVVIQLYLKIRETYDTLRLRVNELSPTRHLQHKDFMFYWSVPQLANDINMCLNFGQPGTGIMECCSGLGQFIGQSYFGGRVWMSCIGEYISSSEGGLEYQDVTSEYALAMTGWYPFIPRSHTKGAKRCLVKSCNEDEEKYKVPYWEYKEIEINPEIQTLQDIIDTIYHERARRKADRSLFDFEYMRVLDSIKFIVRCNVYAPEEGDLIMYGPIPMKRYINNLSIGELFFSNKDQPNRILNSVHIRTLLMAGWRVEVLQDEYNILFHQQCKVFNQFIEIIGSDKTKAREDGNKTLGKLLKRVLTSLYGKQAQRVDNKLHTQTLKDNRLGNFDVRVENWGKSRVYHATFICAYANDILFTTMYKLCSRYVYLDRPLSDKTGLILYADTDSIVFDPDLCEKYEFTQGEDIGVYDDVANEFKITWKRKYTEKHIASGLFIAKKVYMMLDSNKKFICVKIKGVHSGQMNQFTYPILKNIIHSKHGNQITFETLTRTKEPIKPDDFNSPNDFIRSIKEAMQKKTLSVMKENFESIKSTNEIVIKNNKQQLDKEILNETTNHHLEFIIV